MTLAIAENLHTLLSASYPFVYLVTWEEGRVLGLVRELAQTLGRTVRLWRPEEHTDPGRSLDQVLDACAASTEPDVAVVLDAHPYLNDPARIRRLRVVQRQFSRTGGVLVFIGPVAVTPPELERDWTVVHVPLPDRDELAGLLEATVPRGTYPDVVPERMTAAAMGLTGREARRAFERARHLHRIAAARGQAFDWEAAVVEEKRRLMGTAGAVRFVALDVALDHVGGLEELKRWIGERSEAFGPRARAFGLPSPKGLLMLGVQGCGKSLAARAVAGYWGLPLLQLDPGALFSSSVSPDDALRRAIAAAEAMAPCVMWVDEIEKAFGDAGGETTRLLGSLLSWLQDRPAPVFFVATANRVDTLPPELLRRGRFDEIFFVDLPDAADRRAILDIHLRLRDRDPAGFDIDELAAASEHYSGAELEQVVSAALYGAFAAGRELEQHDLLVAIRQLVPLYALYETEIKALRTWAQGRARKAGHDRKLADLFAR